MFYALYQAPDGLLYIGTGGAGLLVYDSVEDRFVRQYQTENCALISNNIHTIVPRADGTLLLETENSVALFRRESGTFRNWTAEQAGKRMPQCRGIHFPARGKLRVRE